MYKSSARYLVYSTRVAVKRYANKVPCVLTVNSLQQDRLLSTNVTTKFNADHDPSVIKKNFRALLEKEREQAKIGGGVNRILKQHARGSLTARERLELLFDNNTFHELDQLKSHRCTEFEMDQKKFPGDGIGTYRVPYTRVATSKIFLLTTLVSYYSLTYYL
jgi:Carboxyl transferase domain